MSPLLLWIACTNKWGDGIVRAAAGTDLFEMSPEVPQRVFEIDIAAETEGLGRYFVWMRGEATLVDGSSGTLDLLVERDDGGWIDVDAAYDSVDALGESILFGTPLSPFEHHSCDDDCDPRYRYTLSAPSGDGTFVAGLWFGAHLTGVQEGDDASLEVTFTEVE